MSQLFSIPYRRLIFLCLLTMLSHSTLFGAESFFNDIKEFERERVLGSAHRLLLEPPITITAFPVPARSAAGMHDFYSEGDFWWPDPDQEDGKPYIRRDGQSNPNKFNDHRIAMRRLSIHVPALVAAYLIEGDERFAKHAVSHLNAWFVNESTRMNTNLQFAQAIPGRNTGRFIGIIDTLHLVEVARAASVLERNDLIPPSILAGIHDWFREYTVWLTESHFGIRERDHGNNHSTAWLVQVAAFADLLNDQELLADARRRFMDIIIPKQMDADGSFPDELERTKPFGYSLFNWDLYGILAQILSNDSYNLWYFETSDGLGMKKANGFIVPFINDKSAWPFSEDIQYWDEWPMAHPTLLFSGIAFEDESLIDLWKGLPKESSVHEVIRNFPVRQPLIWLDPS